MCVLRGLDGSILHHPQFLMSCRSTQVSDMLALNPGGTFISGLLLRIDLNSQPMFKKLKEPGKHAIAFAKTLQGGLSRLGNS